MAQNTPFIEKIGEREYLDLIEKLKEDLPNVYKSKKVDSYITSLAFELGVGKTTLYTKIVKPLTKEFDLKPKPKQRSRSSRKKIILTSSDKEKITTLYRASFFPTKKAFYDALKMSNLLGSNLPCRTTIDRCLEQADLDTTRHNTSGKAERKNRVYELYNQNKQVEEICEICKLTSQVVKSYLREYGISFNKNSSQSYQLEVLDYYYEHGTPATVEKYGVPQNTQARWRKAWVMPARYNNNKSRLYDLDQDFFKSIDTEEKAYLAGLLAADGNVYKNVIGLELKRSDKELLSKVSCAIGSNKPIMDTIHYSKKHNTYYEGAKVAFISKDLVSQLFLLGLTENKSNTLDVNLNLIPTNLLRHFWRGVIDGDGSLFIKNQHEVDTPVVGLYGSKSICSKFRSYILKTLNISLGGPWVHFSIWATCCQKQGESKIIVQHLYEGSNISLLRKQKLAESWYTK